MAWFPGFALPERPIRIGQVLVKNPPSIGNVPRRYGSLPLLYRRLPHGVPMTRSFLILLLARLAFCADPPPVFVFAADSLSATVTPIGGKALSAQDSSGPGSSLTFFPCDPAAEPAASGPAAWYEVEVNDKRNGSEVRFPMDERSLQRGLRMICREDSGAAPDRVAAALRAMAARLKVRMGGPTAGSGK